MAFRADLATKAYKVTLVSLVSKDWTVSQAHQVFRVLMVTTGFPGSRVKLETRECLVQLKDHSLE